MGRPQQHLSEVVRVTGSGDATAQLRALMVRGLFVLEEEKRAARLAERGTLDKLNPHISDAGKCPRQVTYSLRNIEPSDPMTEDSLMNFLVGHAVEEAWAKILTAAGAEYVREERVSIPAGSTVVTGRKDFDGIRLVWSAAIAERLGLPELQSIPDGAIVELKSINSRAMAFMLKRGEKGKSDHRRQLGLYLHATGKLFGFLVYLVKDATKGEPILHAWGVEYDEAQATTDLTALGLADEIAKGGQLAPIPEGNSQNKYPCSYCSWRTACWLQASLDRAAAMFPDEGAAS